MSMARMVSLPFDIMLSGYYPCADVASDSTERAQSAEALYVSDVAWDGRSFATLTISKRNMFAKSMSDASRLTI